MKKIWKFIKIFVILSIICLAIVFYAFKIEPNLLVVNEVVLEINENPQNEMKIVLFSDTHFKTNTSESYTKKIIQKINDEQPDVVMFLGDLIDNQQETPVDIDFLVEALSDINGQKLAIMGNHDYGGGAERTYKEILEKSDFNLLINQSVEIDGITIIGIDDLYFGNPDYSILENIDISSNTLVMLHEGDMIKDLDKNFDMAFSGHSHGGQIAIPILKDIVTPAGAEAYIKGLYEDDKIYVTSGIGTTFINARLFCIPEIVSITLKY